VATILLCGVDVYFRGKLEALLPGHHFVTTDSADWPDLVIADIRMADLDGPALLDALAERFGDALPHIIFLTRVAFDPHYGSFLANLRAPVLTKPLKPGRVLELVGRVLES